MFTSSRVASSVRVALTACALSTSLTAVSALAQEAESEEAAVEKIQVTGSRISGVNIESSSPVVTVEAELFDIRGTTDTVDLINTLPSVFASQTTAFANGATGTSTVDLRGLGSQRTLVLVDGKRLPPGGPLAGFAPDLNLIAPQIVDRVDVVTGGASAVYGSDAIAGVVNFITRKDFEGIELDVQYGVNQSDNDSGFWAERLEAIGEDPATGTITDNQTIQVNLVMGAGFDDGRGNLTGYLNYTDSNGAQQRDRDFAQCATFPVSGDDLICLGSNQGPFPTSFVIGAQPFLDENGDPIDDLAFDSAGNPLFFGDSDRQAQFRRNVPLAGFLQTAANRQLAYNADGEVVTPDADGVFPAGSILAFDAAGNPILNPITSSSASLGLADDSLSRGLNNAYNFNPFNPVRRAVERFNVGFKGYYDITDDLQTYMDFGFTTSESPQVIAPSAAFGSTINRVNCDNPLLTPESREAICGSADINGPFLRDQDGDGYAQSNVRRRFVEGGGRTDLRQRSTFRSMVGVKGVIDDTFDWDLFAQYAETRLQRIQFNQVTLANLENALDIVTDPATGQPACRVAVNGTDTDCVPFTSAYQNGVASDPALIAYVDTPTLTTGTSKQTIVGGTFSGDFSEYGLQSPFADEGISALFGFEYRRDELLEQADGIAANGLLVGSGGATVPTNGETEVAELFTEISVPLLSGMTGAEQLNLTLAYRYSDYESENRLLGNTGGEFDADTFALGMAWVPIDDLRFRAQFQRAIRAPNVLELFSPQNSGLTSLNDPCSGPSPSASVAECANTGLDPNLYGTVAEDSGQLNTLTGGNPMLEPEESDTVTLGVVYTPSFVDNLTISLDYFDITVEGAIGTIPAATSLDQCLRNGAQEFCSLIQRGPDGSLTFFPREQAFIQTTSQNVAEFATSGLDIQVMYSYDTGDYGEFSVNYNSTWLDSIETTSLPGTPSFDCAGLYGQSCGNPNAEYRHNAILTWNSPFDLSVSMVWRHISEVDLVGTINNGFDEDGSITTAVQDGDRYIDEQVEAMNYFDVTAFYPLTDNITLRAGINNILDEDPPIVTTFGAATGTNVEANTIAGVYDAAGRFMFVGATLTF